MSLSHAQAVYIQFNIRRQPLHNDVVCSCYLPHIQLSSPAVISHILNIRLYLFFFVSALTAAEGAVGAARLVGHLLVLPRFHPAALPLRLPPAS
jgi:hypothetical protein